MENPHITNGMSGVDCRASINAMITQIQTMLDLF